MISDKSSLASRLGWIMSDAEQAIEKARQQFAEYAQSNDGSGLSGCREACRQIWGVLDILGADGASMLGREIVLLLDALIQHKVENVKAAQEAIAEGLLQLSEYLRHLQEGYADLPVVVLPTLNNLRAARDAELLSEHLVFLPEDGHVGNEQIGTEEYTELSPEKLQQVATKLRFYFQKALLGWFRNEQPQRMLQATGKVASNMVVLNNVQRLRALWWITSALSQALAEGRLDHSVAVKMLMGRMEREIRRFGEMGEMHYDQTVPDELLKNLLYYVGLAESGSSVTDKVKTAYNLDLYLPQGETLSELRQHYTMPGRDLWHAVANSVIDELQGLQGMLEGMQEEEHQPELLAKLAEKTSRLASTLGMIGLGHAAELTEHLGKELDDKAVKHTTQSLDELLQISTHYVKLEKVLKEYAQTGYDTTDTIFSEEGEGQDPSTTRSLLRTTLSELNKAQSRMVSFYKEGWAFYYLDDVVVELENISGALNMLDVKELLPMVSTTLRYLREDLLTQRREPSNKELSVFADILTLLEASISTRQQDEDYFSLLPTGYEKLRELDQYSKLDLLNDIDLDEITQDVEAKKSTTAHSFDALSEDQEPEPTSTASLTEALTPSQPEPPSLHESLGDEIFEIFTEEVAEITTTLGDLFPQWDKDRNDHGLLTEIRRGFHTLKGSGRMAGAFALGEFGWAYENLLNHILSGQLPANDRVSSQVHKAIQELESRLAFFQTAQAVDAGVESMVTAAEAIVAGEDDITPVFQPALARTNEESNTSKIIAPEGWLVDDESEAEASVVEAEDWLQSDVAAETAEVPQEAKPQAEVETASVADVATSEDWLQQADNEEDGSTPVSEDWLQSDEAEESGVAEPVEAHVPPESDDWLQDTFEAETASVESEGIQQVAGEADTPEEMLEEVLDFTDLSLPIEEPEPLFLHADVVPASRSAIEEEQDAETQMIWQLFWEEVPDQLQSLDQNLQRLLDEPGDQEIIRELEREFHTLKGGARMAQLTDMADISHEAESLLNHLSGSGGADQEVLDTLQASIDKLHSLAEIYQQGGAVAQPIPASESTLPVAEPLLEPEDIRQVESEARSEMPVFAVETDTADGGEDIQEQEEALTDSWAKLEVEQGEFSSLLERMLAEQAESLPDISVLGIPARVETTSVQVTEEPKQANNHETIRLQASFIDHLIDSAVGLNVQQIRMSEYFNGMGGDVAELGRTVARLRQQIRALELESEAQIHDGRSIKSATAAGPGFDPLEMDQYAEIQRISRSLAESLNDLVNLEADLSGQLRKGEQLLQEDMRTTRKIQQALLETRLVALTMLVPRLRRLVRQTAGELGKQVNLGVQGEECELDRNLLQNMTAPLEHLIRNAISHGIETPEERESKGKPAIGNITLNVSRDDSEIVIRFRDDGRGLNREKLLKRGQELGFIQPGQTLPDNELDRLILRTGFSTADAVSQISGRGIGMDVVHSELKALGGSLQIESTPGEGTEFIMRLPFTMVVNPVLLAEVHGQVFALPMSGIQGLARISGGDIRKLLDSGEKQLEFAGELYHLRQLAEQLGAGAQSEFAEEDMFPVVFCNVQAQAIAWVIDRIKGRREVVLQPLGVLFNACRLYSAATVSPDGAVYLVPDMAELARRVMHDNKAVDDSVIVEENTPPEPEVPAGPPRIMVVDDSITVRRVTEKFLNAQEYVVATAKDGMEALERVGEFRPDAVLLDIEMPRMDGFELLGHLRRDPQWQTLPVIMISSRTAQKHREHALSMGATSFLGKPYQNEILLDTLQDVLATGHNPNGEHVSA